MSTRAEDCLAASKKATVAAWIYVIDQHDLPPSTPVPPEEFWNAFEGLYFDDLIDDAQFYNDAEAEKIRTGRRVVQQRDVQDALWRLHLIRLEREDMTKPSDLFGESPFALAPVPQNGTPPPGAMTTAMPMFGEVASADQLFGPSRMAPYVFEETRAPDMFTPPSQGPMSELVARHPATPSSLGCVENQPFDINLNVQITSCNRPISIAKEDAKNILSNTEYITAEDSGGDHDIAEFVFHGRCDVCQTEICASAVKPVMRGTLGPMR